MFHISTARKLGLATVTAEKQMIHEQLCSKQLQNHNHLTSDFQILNMDISENPIVMQMRKCRLWLPGFFSSIKHDPKVKMELGIRQRTVFVSEVINDFVTKKGCYLCWTLYKPVYHSNDRFKENQNGFIKEVWNGIQDTVFNWILDEIGHVQGGMAIA